MRFSTQRRLLAVSCLAALPALLVGCDHEPNDINRSVVPTSSAAPSSPTGVTPSVVASSARLPAALTTAQLRDEGVTPTSATPQHCEIAALQGVAQRSWQYPSGSTLTQTSAIVSAPITADCGVPITLEPTPRADQVLSWCGEDCGVLLRRGDRVSMLTVQGTTPANATAALRRLAPRLAQSFS